MLFLLYIVWVEMKKLWIVLVVVLLLAAGAYLGRHQLESLMGGSPVPTAAPVVTVAPTSPAPANNIYMSKTDASKGAYMTDFAGMTLYTFDKDTAGVSNCYNACAKTWPPYTSGAASQGNLPANVTVVTRTDGIKQFAWKGMPLYYFASDTKVGDLTGDGVGSVWHLVKM